MCHDRRREEGGQALEGGGARGVGVVRVSRIGPVPPVKMGGWKLRFAILRCRRCVCVFCVMMLIPRGRFDSAHKMGCLKLLRSLNAESLCVCSLFVAATASIEAVCGCKSIELWM